MRCSAAGDLGLLGEQPRVVEREPGARRDAARELDELRLVAAAGGVAHRERERPEHRAARGERQDHGGADAEPAEQLALLVADALADQVGGRDRRVDLGDARARDGGRADRGAGVGGLAVGQGAGDRLLGRVRDGDGDRLDAVAPGEVDRAEVGERGHDRLDELLEHAGRCAPTSRAPRSRGRAPPPGPGRSRPPRSAACSSSAASWRTVTSTTTLPTPVVHGEEAHDPVAPDARLGRRLAREVDLRRRPPGLEHAPQRGLDLGAELAEQLGRACGRCASAAGIPLISASRALTVR